jgi:hypothetical protein
MERDGAPPHFYAPRDYRFIPDRPVVGDTPSVYATVLRPDGTASPTDVPPPGSRIVLDVPDSPFVTIRSGATRAGATADGLLVVDVDQTPSDIVLARAVPLPARIGRWLTLLGLVSAFLLIIACPRLTSQKSNKDTNPVTNQ